MSDHPYILSDCAGNQRGYTYLITAIGAYCAAEKRREFPQLSGPNGPIMFSTSPLAASKAGYSFRQIAANFIAE